MTPTAHYHRLMRRLVGTQGAARALAAQDVPLPLALLLLGIAPSRVPAPVAESSPVVADEPRSLANPGPDRGADRL